MTKIIGLTGGIGSGKTTLLHYIADKNFPVYVADDAGKQVMEKPDIIEKINTLFKNEVLQADGFLDRKKIGAIVFNDPSLLERLNEIVHPAVAADFEEFKRKNKNSKLVFKESAILFESGSYQHCDATILITAPVDVRIARVMKRDLISEEDIRKRIKNQMSDAEKAVWATYIVENVDLHAAFKKIDEILESLLNN